MFIDLSVDTSDIANTDSNITPSVYNTTVNYAVELVSPITGYICDFFWGSK